MKKIFLLIGLVLIIGSLYSQCVGCDEDNNATIGNRLEIPNDTTIWGTDTIIGVSYGDTTAGNLGSRYAHYDTVFTDCISNGYQTTCYITIVDMADDGTYDLPDATTIKGEIRVEGDDERANFYVQADGTCTIDYGVNTVNTDTDTSLCIYNSAGTQATVKQRLGSAKTVHIIIHHQPY